MSSVEPRLLSAIVETGDLRSLYRNGIQQEDFQLYEEEFDWIVRRHQNGKPINQRLFQKKFDDFDWVDVTEEIPHLCEELRQERAFIEMKALLETVASELEPENAFQTAQRARDILGSIVRLQNSTSDVLLTADWQGHLEKVKQLRILRDKGKQPGWSTGLSHLDFHWDGLQPSRLITVLGRPGEGKSYLLEYMCASLLWQGARVGLFSPEMDEFEHLCRLHTILSAKKEIQEELGLSGAFRNRALMRGEGFNMKKYGKFMEYLDTLPGEVILFSQKYRKEKMSPAFIEARVDDLALDAVFIDPIYKLKSPRRFDSPTWEVAAVVDAIEDMAKGMHIPVVISNQAHRQGGLKGNAPGKDRSFNTDVPIQESDYVIGCKHISEDKEMDLWCSKNRYGSPFHIRMRFVPNVGILQEMGEVKGDYLNGHDEELAEAVVAEAVSERSRSRRKAQPQSGRR